MPTTLTDLDWPRHTARLVLRPATPADAEAIYAYRSLAPVGEWLMSAAGSWDEFQASYPQRMGRWLVVEHHGRVIGGCKIDLQDGFAQIEQQDAARGVQGELGWTFHPDVFGQGFATEIAAELLVICFEGLGLRRVIANCFTDNVASWKIMERIGMRREAHYVGDSLHRDGRWLDSYAYALLADEWRAQRGAG